MNAQSFYKLVNSQFPFKPTLKQATALELLSDFIFSPNNQQLFLLKGYAGTGKTTLISSLTKHLWCSKTKFILLAPTGRAAKVVGNYAKRNAYTIHKKIYYPKQDKAGAVKFVLQPNNHHNTLFIIDEASMIPDQPTDNNVFDKVSLLDDLIQFVYSGKQCKVILIGDTAQLPPVHLDLSPALNPDLLNQKYDQSVIEITLDQVVRQSEDSGILANATQIREQIRHQDFFKQQFCLGAFSDIKRLANGSQLEEALVESYQHQGQQNTVVIVRSNKRANLFNQQIRSRILFNEEELSPGDRLMVVKNNYFWLEENSDASFIANGDTIEVLKIFSFKNLYGFRFAEASVQMTDYTDIKPFKTVLLLDTINAESASLSYEDSNRLYQEVMKDYQEIGSNYRKFLKVKKNKFFNALQVKFSYAITCHKSQGGQWDTVFVEQPYLPNGIDRNYLRWLYTAVTRAKKKLFLVGFKDENFK